jgi:hypothetical protein
MMIIILKDHAIMIVGFTNIKSNNLTYKSNSGVCLSVVTNRAWAGHGQGKAGQGSRCRGPCEVPFLLKKSLGKTGGPASNQTKI